MAFGDRALGSLGLRFVPDIERDAGLRRPGYLQCGLLQRWKGPMEEQMKPDNSWKFWLVVSALLLGAFLIMDVLVKDSDRGAERQIHNFEILQK